MSGIMYQLKEEFWGTNEAMEVVLNEDAYNIASERFVKTAEDEEILISATAESEHMGSFWDLDVHYF